MNELLSPRARRLCAALLFSAVLTPRPLGQEEREPRITGKALEVERSLVVGTTAPAAIHAGVDVLDRGGSAVDAALTTALAQITLCAGCWVSFAGRLTAVVYDAESEEVVALNACYDAPREEDDPLGIPNQPTPSGRTALVPGFMAGVGALHERFGELELAELFAPSIELAEDGFELTPNLARLIRNKRDVLLRTEHGRRVFLDEDEELHQPGALFRQVDLARTLRRTAAEGTDYFYTGEWAKRFVELVRAEGGKLTLADLAAYRPRWQTPIATTYGDTTIHGMPAPNRGGPSVALALNLADHAKLVESGDPATSAKALHDLASIELALDVVWTARGREALADEAPGATALWEESFADREAARSLWEAIASPAWKRVLGRTWNRPLRDEHSDAIVAVDRRGNVVAMIHTINTAGWGTTGIFVDGVSIPDSGAGQQRSMQLVGPGGRMPDHGVPLIGMRGGLPVLASSATGSGNVEASWQNTLRILGYGLSPAATADGPNLYGGSVQRSDFSPELVEAVRERGFPLEVVERFGGFQRGFWVGVTLDPESGGMRAACVSVLDGVGVGR